MNEWMNGIVETVKKVLKITRKLIPTMALVLTTYSQAEAQETAMGGLQITKPDTTNVIGTVNGYPVHRDRYETIISLQEAQTMLNDLSKLYNQYSALKTQNGQSFQEILEILNTKFPAYCEPNGALPSASAITEKLTAQLRKNNITLTLEEREYLIITIMIKNMGKAYNMLYNKQQRNTDKYNFSEISQDANMMREKMLFNEYGNAWRYIYELLPFLQAYYEVYGINENTKKQNGPSDKQRNRNQIKRDYGKVAGATQN